MSHICFKRALPTRTPRGRCVTQKAYDHLHIPYLGQQSFEL